MINTVQNGKGSLRRPESGWSGSKPARVVLRGDRVCGNCAHWCEKHAATRSGQCRRYSPRKTISVGDISIIAWPTTMNTDFCGEFARGVKELKNGKTEERKKEGAA